MVLRQQIGDTAKGPVQQQPRVEFDSPGRQRVELRLPDEMAGRFFQRKRAQTAKDDRGIARPMSLSPEPEGRLAARTQQARHALPTGNVPPFKHVRHGVSKGMLVQCQVANRHLCKTGMEPAPDGASFLCTETGSIRKPVQVSPRPFVPLSRSTSPRFEPQRARAAR